jgi:SAM-dependent methyltransferase
MDISDNVKKVWNSLGKDYAVVGKRPDSLDILIEAPAQFAAVGDFKNKTILDLGCGVGEKSFYFLTHGASHVTAVDISNEFIEKAQKNFQHPNLEFICGNLRNIKQIREINYKKFELITCFQAMSYSDDLTLSFSAIADHLEDDGKFVVTFPSPLRFAVEKSERFQMPVAKAYYERGLYSYPATWNAELTVEHYLFSFSDILNSAVASGLKLLKCHEPELDEDSKKKFPHKAAWMEKYGGIVIFEFIKN